MICFFLGTGRSVRATGSTDVPCVDKQIDRASGQCGEGRSREREREMQHADLLPAIEISRQ